MELLASGYTFLEAPRYDGRGGLYFVDDKAVYHLDGDGALEVVDGDRPAGGILLHRSGGIVVSGASVVHLLPDRRQRELLVLPGVGWINDIYADGSGRVLCGSIPEATTGTEQDPPAGHLWRIEQAGRATRLYGDVGFSNGIALSPDGRALYHCDTVCRRIIVHDVDGDELTRLPDLPTTAVSGGPDGLAVDQAGYLWAAMYGGGCIARFSPKGEVERVIDLPAVNVTSVAFGGQDDGQLFVVTCDNTETRELGGCIYRLEAPESGLPTPMAAV